jgi:hypothetical protein
MLASGYLSVITFLFLVVNIVFNLRHIPSRDPQMVQAQEEEPMANYDTEEAPR